jgi:hypothetical protein
MSETTVVYSGRTTNWPLLAAACIGGLALMLLGRPWAGPWPGMFVMLAIALGALFVAVVTTTSLRVTTGPHGVHIRCGVFGWPRFTYRHERIASTEIVTVSIWQSWNSGINWSPRAGWTFALRSGPAVRLTLLNGRLVTFGVSDPQLAIAALTAPPPSAVRR